MHGQLSHIEAQRFLSAIVAAETARIRAERHAEPIDQTPGDWLARASSERVRKAAAEIVSARGTAAILLPEDERRLAAEGLGSAEIAQVPAALTRLVDWLVDPNSQDDVARTALTALGRAPRDGRETRMFQYLHLSAQARALGRMDRIKATGPLIADEAVLDPAVVSEASFEPPASIGGGVAVQATACGSRLSPSGGNLGEVRTEGRRADLPGEVEDRILEREGEITATERETMPKDQLSKLVEAMIAKEFPEGRTEAAEKSLGKERRQCRAVLTQFVEAIGDKRLADLTQADVGHYVDLLACLPKIYGRSPADRNRSLRELVERAEELPDEEVGLSANTVNRNLGHLKRLLKYARGRSMRPTEQIELADLRAKDRRDARSVREAFDEDDLAKLSRHPVWSGCKSASRRNEAGREILQDGLYWGPLLAAYTGARREELMGMRVCEVHLDGPIPYLAIRPNPNRGLKNSSSERDIPIHPRLFELGLGDYVKALAVKGEVDLFPELRPTSTAETFGANLYKRWQKAKITALGEGEKRKTFHSFRHTVITYLRQETDVSKLVVAALVGHTPEGETDGRYTKRLPLEKIAEAVRALPKWF
jgi:integrase